MHVQRAAEHRVVPWANGLGVTADVFLSPTDAGEWAWRLSIADVSDDLPFSTMPGIDRHIVVASGAGMSLTIDGAPEYRMDRRTPPLPFDGESVTTCRLLDGPIADLNLMVRRAAGAGSLRTVRLAMGQTLRLSGDDAAVVVLDGEVRFGSDDLVMYDAVRRDPAETVDGLALTDLVCAVASVRLD